VALVRDGKPLLYSELDITPGGIDTLLGVEDNHRWVASGAFRTARALGLRADDVVLTAWPSGSAGWVRDLTSAWMAGASVVDVAAQRADGAALANRIVESGASVVDLLPAQWRAVHAAAQEDAELRKQLATGALRLLISSGQLLHARTAEAMLAVGGPATAVLSAYVSPVAHGAVAIRQVSRSDLAQDVIPLGHAVDGVELRIVDEQGRPLPLGVPGRIQVVVGGKGHDTDEVGLLDEDGAVRGQGRDRPVFVHGFRVDVELVEAALDRHPAIAQSLVSQREAGAGLDAFVVVERDQRPTRVDIVSFLRDRVPGYMIPTGFRIVTELPRTPEGGIDYTAAATLADRGWAVS
jgi:acyl-coenzyme A synthetase/AMP-(fatty) acid ligase